MFELKRNWVLCIYLISDRWGNYFRTGGPLAKMKLDEESMTNFSVGKTFQREKRINFLDFSYDGLRLITSGEDDQMVIYDCEKGTEKQVESAPWDLSSVQCGT